MATLKNINSPVWGLSVVGYGVIVEGIAAIRQRMDLAIRTTKGTDPLRPEFGSFVFQYVDVPVNVSVPNIKFEITRALQLWVPEIKVISIKHSFPVDYANPQFEVTYRLTDEDLVDKLLFDLKNGSTTETDALSEIILQAFFPDNSNGYRYKVRLVRNGSDMFPLAPPSGFVTISELFQWVSSNWSFVGKWFLLADKVVCYMNAEGVKSASLAIETLPITVFSADFPQIQQTNRVYKVSLIENGSEAVPRMPQIFSNPGDVLEWVKSNWTNYEWSIEFLQASGEGVFSDEFSDAFDVDATGYKLIGLSNQPGFVGNLTIETVEANTFQALFPQLIPGEVFVVDFKKDGVSVNPNVPQIYTNPGDVLEHAKNYWSELADWGINEINAIDGTDQLTDEFSNEFDTQAFDFELVGVAFLPFAAQLTITKA